MNHEQLVKSAFSAHRTGDIEFAERQYLELIDSGFKHEAVINNLSAIWSERGEHVRAITLLESFENKDKSAPILATLAGVYKFLDENQKATEAAKKSLDIDPNQPDTWNILGSTLRSLGRWDEAVEALKTGIKYRPRFTLALYNLANAFLEIRDLETAVDFYKQAIESNPNYANAYVNLGNCYRELNQLDDACSAYKRAHELNPSLLETQFNLGVISMERAQYTEAIEYLSKTLPTQEFGTQSLPHLIGATQKICDWTYSQTLKTLAIDAVSNETYKESPPFNLIAIIDEPDILFRANQQYTKSHINPPRSKSRATSHNGPIKIAYFSCDFHNHATSYLVAELFELHDRQKFDVFLISYGQDAAHSSMRKRIRNSSATFVDAKAWSDREISRYISEQQIDILVDLKGYTAGCRPQVLAERPAPIQLQYLGYPSTMGAEFIDYFIGDHVTNPVELDQFFSETVLRVPGCYQINDSKRHMSNAEITRADVGLPEDDIVFASFNSTYKITPQMWSIWMSILKATPGSVLWLIDDNEWAQINLQRAALELGVEPDRLIFAKKMEQEEHLKRLTLADIALDTFPCCGHTTTSDALFSGLPVITMLGKTFHSRVSASLLTTQNLENLITHSLGEYAAQAINLSSSRETINDLKRQVLNAKKEGALFNTPLWVKNFELLLVEIHEKHSMP